jgi:1-acyl-sn-glycerol-3-phosphate acyltransferase
VGPFVRRWAGLSAGVLSFVYLIFVLNPIQMASVVLYPFSRRAFRGVNRWCARSIWGLWVIMAEVQNRIEIRMTGDQAPPRENALLIPNHQSMADVMVMMCLAWRSGRLGDMKWFVKDIVKWFPGFGWGMKFLDCVFVKRDWAQDRAEIERLFEKYRRQQIPIFLVSFLEGTRLTPGKLARAQAFAKERGMMVPERTLVPRTKGFVATMIGLRDHLDAVYDLTLAYGERVPTLVECFEAKVQRVDVHVRRFEVAELPQDEEALVRWVHQRYREKEELLARHAKDGRFPGTPRSARVRALDWFLPESRRRVTATRDAI